MASFSSYVYSLDDSGKYVYISADSRMCPALCYKVEDDPDDPTKSVITLRAQMRSRYYTGWSDTILKIAGIQVFRGGTYGGDGYDRDIVKNDGAYWDKTITVSKTSAAQSLTYSATLELASSGYNTATISVTVTVPAYTGNVHVKAGGSWHNGQAYVKVNGTWRQAQVYTKVGGTWRVGI